MLVRAVATLRRLGARSGGGGASERSKSSIRRYQAEARRVEIDVGRWMEDKRGGFEKGRLETDEDPRRLVWGKREGYESSVGEILLGWGGNCEIEGAETQRLIQAVATYQASAP